jgi:sigma-B regulation protein RsbU (phosphoserine phosphatase)
MTNHDDPDDSKQPPIELDLVLEAPPAGDALVSSASGLSMGLFEDDSMALAAGKLAVVEAFLKSLTRDQSFGDFTRELLLTVMRVVKSEAGSILEVDHHKNSLFFRSVVGTSSDRVSSFIIPMGQGIVGHVAESRRPLVVANVSENKLHLKAIQDAVGFETRNLVCVPIVIRGRIYGVLELLNRIGEADFSVADVELLTYLCEMAAKAIEIRLMIAWATNQRKSSGHGEAA